MTDVCVKLLIANHVNCTVHVVQWDWLDMMTTMLVHSLQPYRMQVFLS